MMVFASQRIPSISPRNIVEPKSTGPPMKSWKALIPDSRITTPKNSEKISGAATGSKKESSTHITVATHIFSKAEYFFWFFGGSIGMLRRRLGTISLIR